MYGPLLPNRSTIKNNPTEFNKEAIGLSRWFSYGLTGKSGPSWQSHFDIEKAVLIPCGCLLLILKL